MNNVNERQETLSFVNSLTEPNQINFYGRSFMFMKEQNDLRDMYKDDWKHFDSFWSSVKIQFAEYTKDELIQIIEKEFKKEDLAYSLSDYKTTLANYIPYLFDSNRYDEDYNIEDNIKVEDYVFAKEHSRRGYYYGANNIYLSCYYKWCNSNGKTFKEEFGPYILDTIDSNFHIPDLGIYNKNNTADVVKMVKINKDDYVENIETYSQYFKYLKTLNPELKDDEVKLISKVLVPEEGIEELLAKQSRSLYAKKWIDKCLTNLDNCIKFERNFNWYMIRSKYPEEAARIIRLYMDADIHNKKYDQTGSYYYSMLPSSLRDYGSLSSQFTEEEKNKYDKIKCFRRLRRCLTDGEDLATIADSHFKEKDFLENSLRDILTDEEDILFLTACINASTDNYIGRWSTLGNVDLKECNGKIIYTERGNILNATGLLNIFKQYTKNDSDAIKYYRTMKNIFSILLSKNNITISPTSIYYEIMK